MMNDKDIAKKMVSQGDDLKFSLLSMEEERIKFAYYLLLENILLCVRALRQPSHQFEQQQQSAYQFWINRAHQKLQNDCQAAYACLKAIIGYFPEPKKMQRFLTKFDSYIGQQQQDNKLKQSEL